MNEQRTQAYLNLVNQLLSCNQGDEPRILQENRELLDQGLVEVMVAVAKQYGEVGRENEARWLLNMAQQLTGILKQMQNGDFNLSENDHENYFQFIVHILQLVEQNPTPENLYPYLNQNLSKLNETFHQILIDWINNILQDGAKSQVLQRFGIIIMSFGELLSNFSLGIAHINKEIVITCYQTGLRIFSKDTIPEMWAVVQDRLGIAYLERIQGNKSENLRIAINSFKNALQIFTFDQFREEWIRNKYNLAIAYDDANNQEMAITVCNELLKEIKFEQNPHKWADTQNILGNAYRKRTKGDKNSNLAEAITAFENALRVYNRKKSPLQWAGIQANLAAVYRNKTGEDYADKLEIAIKKYEETLQIITFTNSPQEWATIQNNLGVAYSHRIKGNKADNLERAISAHLEALKVPQSHYKWAMVQSNMGNAYRDRINLVKEKKNKLDNFNKAVECFENALRICNRENFPQEWIKIQNNLGIIHTFNLYLFISEEDQNKEIEKGIVAFQNALEVCPQNNNPIEWADLQDNLASAYAKRMSEDEISNLEMSIFHYQQALQVRTFESYPYEWAKTQNNLGCAYFTYSRKIKEGRAENLNKAILAYKDALKFRTKDNDPLKCLETATNLGNLHYLEKQWQPATEAYNIAIEAVENARLEALNPQSRQEVLSNAIDVFHRIVLAYLHLNQPEKALEYIERSKGRNLVELMTQKNLHPQGVSQEIIAQLNELKQRVFNEQIRLHHQSINQKLMQSDNLTPYVPDHSYLKEYQQDLDNFIAREIKDPLFSLTQKVEPIPFTEIQALTDAETCLLQWYITGKKILAFVVSAGGEVKVWQSSEDDIKQLFDTINNYLQLYYSKNGKQEWKNQLSNLLQTFADILHINDILALIPDTCQRLIIIPHLFLHILPLHALPVDPPQLPLKRGESATGGSELQDLFPKGVQYAPSCQILQKISQTSHHSDFNKLFAIQNPTKDLFYTDLEVNILSTFFTEPQVIAKDNATKNAVLPHLKSSDNHCYHFSCHGSFNPDNPLESALFLANKEPLTLGEIFELRLNKCRLITLSACETGLIDLNSISDEYIGLPRGFLFAGSPSVVSSLWTVSDLSTSFLMMKFYEILFDENQQVSVPVALKQAQNWLQNLTVQEYLNQLNNCQKIVKPMQQKLTAKEFNRLMDMIEDEQIRIKGFELNYKLFNNPFYWAAFTAAGI